jgi:hypothetical protein
MKSTDFGTSITGPTLSTLARKYKVGGKVGVVMGEYKRGKLRSGSKKGPKVTNRKQAIAIALSEQRKSLKKKYAMGGSVQPNVPEGAVQPELSGVAGVVQAPIKSNFWQQLQAAIQRLTPGSPFADTVNSSQQPQEAAPRGGIS